MLNRTVAEPLIGPPSMAVNPIVTRAWPFANVSVPFKVGSIETATSDSTFFIFACVSPGSS